MKYGQIAEQNIAKLVNEMKKNLANWLNIRIFASANKTKNGIQKQGN